MYALAVLGPTSGLVEYGVTSIDVALKHNPEMARIDVPF